MNVFLPARQFILDALRMDKSLPQAEMAEQDWEEFFTLSRMHRLGPLLHHALEHVQIPREMRERLGRSRRKNALRNLEVYGELVKIARLFDAAGIDFIALKGAYLAKFAYQEPGLRPMRDLDLLLHPNQAVEAFELLKAQGYASLFEGLPEAYFADRKHLPPLKGPAGISIELHHRLTYPYSPLEFQGDFVEKLWDRSIAREIGGVSIEFLCPEDLLLHLCVHATMEHQLNTGPLALADVAWLIETHDIDWGRFLLDVTTGNWQRCVLPLLYLAKLHLGARVPDEVVHELGGGKDDAAWSASAEYLLFSDPEDHKLLDFDMQDALYSASLSKRLSALAKAAFPPRTTIARHFPVDAKSLAAYLYYPARWRQLAGKKLPALLAAHSGRNSSMRELARQRKAFEGWLKEGVH